MSLAAVLVFVLIAALAAVNGSNDVPKGVATLAGAGVTNYRAAILWGTVTTLAGCVCSLALAEKMTKLFSSGIITAAPTDAFAVAVLVGAASWVGLATWLRLPVSTTHALIGGLLGAGLLLASDSIAWSAVPKRLIIPLLSTIVIAYGISMLLALPFNRRPAAATGEAEFVTPGASATGTWTGTALLKSEPQTEVRPDATAGSLSDRVLTAAHWATSGATGFARGLNDTPKMVAVGAFALVPAGMALWQIVLVIAGAMALGSVTGGMRVAKQLGEGVVRMNHREGFLANLTTASLVGLGAGYGLPMSTTHVSTGAIAGAAGPNLSRVSGSTLRNFAIAWLVTPPFAAVVAAVAFLVMDRVLG
jgi:PiT family inorganic phosphate transporter